MNVLITAEALQKPGLALDIPAGQTFDAWVAMGRDLAEGQRVINWWIGDWWAAGSHRYGERAKAAAEGVFGRDFGTLANLASVCRSFETSRRREHLSFSHHAEVAVLPPAEADSLLQRAEQEMLSTRELRQEVMKLRPLPRKRDVIDVRAPEPACAELLSDSEVIIELAEALSRERALTDRESEFLERALRKAEGGGQTAPWTGQDDLTIIALLRAGSGGAQIAKTLSRTENAIWSRIRQLRRRGLLQGQMAAAEAAG